MFLAFFRERGGGRGGVCDRGMHSPLKAPVYRMVDMIKLGIRRVRSKMPRAVSTLYLVLAICATEQSIGPCSNVTAIFDVS